MAADSKKRATEPAPNIIDRNNAKDVKKTRVKALSNVFRQLLSLTIRKLDMPRSRIIFAVVRIIMHTENAPKLSGAIRRAVTSEPMNWVMILMYFVEKDEMKALVVIKYGLQKALFVLFWFKALSHFELRSRRKSVSFLFRYQKLMDVLRH